jgi:hypothetical protein
MVGTHHEPTAGRTNECELNRHRSGPSSLPSTRVRKRRPRFLWNLCSIPLTGLALKGRRRPSVARRLRLNGCTNQHQAAHRPPQGPLPATHPLTSATLSRGPSGSVPQHGSVLGHGRHEYHSQVRRYGRGNAAGLTPGPRNCRRTDEGNLTFSDVACLGRGQSCSPSARANNLVKATLRWWS